jgi:hypothetical protein
LSEAALWLNYCLAAVAAFCAIYFRRWRIISAMVFGALIAVAVWVAASFGAGGSLDDPWLVAALLINGSFALIFAGLGAAVAQLILSRNSGT